MLYEGVSKSFRTGHLERELQMIQLNKRCCIAILRVSLVSFATIILCVASQRVYIVVISLLTQSGNFWIHSRRVFLQELISVNMVKKIPIFKDTKNLSSLSQNRATDDHFDPIYNSKIYFISFFQLYSSLSSYLSLWGSSIKIVLSSSCLPLHATHEANFIFPDLMLFVFTRRFSHCPMQFYLRTFYLSLSHLNT
jgi:hypothetical protein